MTTFNNAMNSALNCVCLWEKKGILLEVTIIRDVYGKISFLMNNTESADDVAKENFNRILEQNMGPYYSGRIYWKKLSRSQKNIAEREKMIIGLIENKRTEWCFQENIRFYTAERAIAKKAWIYQSDGNESVWPYEDAVSEDGTKVVTFYSFKGGMGRTTTLAGVALMLAEQGKNVFMLDTDIEAPGLATLFFDEEMITKGVLDYLIEQGIDQNVNLTDYVLDVIDAALLAEDTGRLFLMPSGKVDEHYLQKLARIDYQDHRAGYLRKSLEDLLKDIRDHYRVDYILIDARAGFHDMGGITVTQLPHGVVLFGNDSRQSWDGITQVIHTIAQGHEDDFPVMIAGAMCPEPGTPEYIPAREHFINQAYTICLEHYYDTNREIPGIEAEDEIHYPEFIPFNNVILHGMELYSDGSQENNQRVIAYKKILTGESYGKITNRIKKWFGEA